MADLINKNQRPNWLEIILLSLTGSPSSFSQVLIWLENPNAVFDWWLLEILFQVCSFVFCALHLHTPLSIWAIQPIIVTAIHLSTHLFLLSSLVYCMQLIFYPANLSTHPIIVTLINLFTHLPLLISCLYCCLLSLYSTFFHKPSWPIPLCT